MTDKKPAKKKAVKKEVKKESLPEGMVKVINRSGRELLVPRDLAEARPDLKPVK